MVNALDLTTDAETVYDQATSNSYNKDSYMLTKDEVTILYKSLLCVKWCEHGKSGRRNIIRQLIQSQYEPPSSTEIFKVADTIEESDMFEDMVDQKV